MAFRRLITMGLFACLAATAASALIAVFVFEDWAWKLTGTSFILSVTAALWAVATRHERAQLTPVVMGLLGGTGVAALFFCLAIWRPAVGPFMPRELGTGMIALGMTVFTAAPLRLLGVQRARPAARAALALLALAALLWLAEVWGLLWRDDGRCGWILVCASYVLGAILLRPVADATQRQLQVSRGWRVGGAVVTLAAVLMWFACVTDSTTGIDGIYPPTGIHLLPWAVGASAFAVALGMTNILRFAKGPPWTLWLHRVAVASVLAQGALLAVVIDVDVEGDFVARIMVSLTVLILSSLTASLILDRKARARVARSAMDLVDIRIECPLCSTKQTVALGESACRHCGLGLAIAVRQTKCFQCGYVLAGNPGATACPECGCALAAGTPATAC